LIRKERRRKEIRKNEEVITFIIIKRKKEDIVNQIHHHYRILIFVILGWKGTELTGEVEHLGVGQEAGSCHHHRLRLHRIRHLSLQHQIQYTLLKNHLILAGDLLHWISYHAADRLTECAAAKL
jgi:hypothetical protein